MFKCKRRNERENGAFVYHNVVFIGFMSQCSSKFLFFDNREVLLDGKEHAHSSSLDQLSLEQASLIEI